MVGKVPDQPERAGHRRDLFEHLGLEHRGLLDELGRREGDAGQGDDALGGCEGREAHDGGFDLGGGGVGGER